LDGSTVKVGPLGVLAAAPLGEGAAVAPAGGGTVVAGVTKAATVMIVMLGVRVGGGTNVAVIVALGVAEGVIGTGATWMVSDASPTTLLSAR